MFYSEIGKLTVEYLKFNTITNIEYLKNFKQDHLFITIIFEKNEDFRLIPYRYFEEKRQYNPDTENIELRRCASSYNYNSSILDNNLLITIDFICGNITFNRIMNRNFFFDYYLSDGNVIKFENFINSSRYSIGYLISQRNRNEVFKVKPILTFQLSNVLYDKDNISVSINFN